MGLLARLCVRLVRGLKPESGDTSIDEEIRFHLEEEARLRVKDGDSPQEARDVARRAFGSTALIKERTRAVWAWTFLEQTMQDVRLAFRMLRRAPAFTVAALATLALGIGANSAVFSLFNALVLERLPVHEPDRIVLFSDITGEGTSRSQTRPTGRWDLFSTGAYRFLAERDLGFSSLAAVRSGETEVALRITGTQQAGATERAQAHLVSGTYFDVMGVDAEMGRTLTPADDVASAAPAVVASAKFWRDRLAADPRVIGRAISLNGMQFTIVGVTPDAFYGERVRTMPDVWAPLVFQPQIEERAAYTEGAYWLSLLARMRPGVTIANAQARSTQALHQFLTDAAGSDPDEERRTAIAGARVELVEGSRGISGLRQEYGQPLQILLAVVGLVLVIACANVGTLLMSRSAARRAEMSLRAALGASPSRILRQLLAESLVLAAGGAAAGLLVARTVVNAALPLIAARTTPLNTGIGSRVLLFTAFVACIAALVFGIAPVLASRRSDLLASLKSGPARGTAASLACTRALVVTQIALSLVLLIAAGLFARSLLYVEDQFLGFDKDHVVVLRVNPKLAGYTSANARALQSRVSDALARLPGVRAVTIAGYSPFSGNSNHESVSVQGYAPSAGEHVEIESLLVGPSYAETMGMPVREGRGIAPVDTEGAPNVAVVNEAFERHFFPGASAIHRRFGFGGPNLAGDIEIVGVIGDAKFHDDQAIAPMAFLPMAQDDSDVVLSFEVAVAANGDPRQVLAPIRRALSTALPGVPADTPRLLSAQVSNRFNRQRLAARLIDAFGALALLLASVGLYGVMAQSVSRRTREIGVRMALGAEPRNVLSMIFREATRLVATGLAAGCVVALVASRLVGSQLYGVTPYDPWSFTIALAVLAAVGTITALIPANRASRIEPVVALRCE